MTKVVIIGAAGRMGQALVRCCSRFGELRLAGAVEAPGCPALGKDAGVVAGTPETGVTVVADLKSALSGADVGIDFSAHAAIPGTARLASECRTALVIGTTGLTDAEKAAVMDASRAIPIVMSPSMSVGVNVLFSLVGKAAAALGNGYDVEIVEMHHRHKKDAPSGTALRLGEKVAEGRGQDFRRVAAFGREGDVGERPAGQIGLHAVRGGDVVGDHTVTFATDGERVEFVHRAGSRDSFAMGALRAAVWVAGRPAGLYSMLDVLGL